MSAEQDEPFIVMVKGKGRRRFQAVDKRTGPAQPVVKVHVSDSGSRMSVESWMARLNETGVLKQVTDMLEGKRVESCFALGLGPLTTSSVEPKVQFALMALLRAEWKCKVVCSDPLFQESDDLLIKKHGCETAPASNPFVVPGAVEAGSDSVLLYYMPHCPLEMYIQVVEHHHQATTLNRVVIIGNSVSAILEDRNLDLLKSIRVSQTALPVIDSCPNAFHGTYVSSFAHV
jgi:hypothetical protein